MRTLALERAGGKALAVSWIEGPGGRTLEEDLVTATALEEHWEV